MISKKSKYIIGGVLAVAIFGGYIVVAKLKGDTLLAESIAALGGIKYCNQAGEYLEKNYDLKLSVPLDFCFISSSVSENGTYLAQVIPSDAQLGSVIESVDTQRAVTSKVARVTVMVEPETPGRMQTLVTNLSRSGGLATAEISNVTNPYGIRYMKLHNVASSDGVHFYDMALIEHQSGNYLISIISPRPNDPTVFKYILDRAQVSK